jgi:hypothetical protein
MKQKENIELETNSAVDLMHLLAKVLLQPESGADGLPTGVMIELPDDSVVPVNYVWYDRERDMVRLSFENE